MVTSAYITDHQGTDAIWIDGPFYTIHGTVFFAGNKNGKKKKEDIFK
jgi:hypothetical protein